MTSERGAALVEFALVSLVLYLLLAAAIDFGRMMFIAQALQDVARVTARELSVTPFAADISFSCAMFTQGCPPGYVPPIDPASGRPLAQARIFNPGCLVIDLDAFTGDTADADLENFFATMPIANRMLRGLMMIDRSSSGRFLRFPGALVQRAAGAPGPDCGPGARTDFTVAIPLTGRDAAGDTITWVPLIEEITAAGATGPFSLTNPTLTPGQRGLVALRVNFPYQAAMMTAFAPRGFDNNVDSPLEEGGVSILGGDPGGDLLPNGPTDDPDSFGPYKGKFGLGRQLALGGKTVRPFRRLMSAHAIFRREVFQ